MQNAQNRNRLLKKIKNGTKWYVDRIKVVHTRDGYMSAKKSYAPSYPHYPHWIMWIDLFIVMSSSNVSFVYNVKNDSEVNKTVSNT